MMKAGIFYRLRERFTNVGANWDKLASDISEAIGYAHAHINREPKRKHDVHHFTMEYCLAHSGEAINDRYRQDRTCDIDLKIAGMVASHSTDTDLVVYRGVCEYVFGLMKKNARKMGDCDLYEKGFLATSLVKGHEINSKIKLRIRIPAGTRCVYMGNVNYEQDFYEVDVMHGSRLKIISMDEEYINCELLSTM